MPIITRRKMLYGAAAAGLVGSGAAGAAEPVNVGGVTPLTGAGSPFGPSIAAALKRVADLVNREGGILGGRPVNLIVEDSETNPEPAARAAAKLVNVNKVQAILGTFSSSVTLGIMPFCQERNIVQMFTSSSADIPAKDAKHLTFNFQILSDVWGRALGNLGKQRGLATYALMALNNDFTKSMMDGFIEVVGKGAILGTPFYYNGGQSSYRPEVEKLTAGNPQAVFIPAYVTDFTAVFKELYSSGYPGKVMTSSLAITPEFKKAVGSAANGILHGFPVPPLQSPAYKQFLAEAGLKDTGEVQQPFGSAGRDEMSVYLLAVEKAGTIEGPAVARAVREVTAEGAGKEVVYDVSSGLRALRAGKSISYSGASSAVKFDDRNQLRGRDFALWEIKGGKDVLLAYLNQNG